MYGKKTRREVRTAVSSHTHTYVQTHERTHMHTHIVHTTHMQIYTYTCKHTESHTHTHTYTNKHTHTDIPCNRTTMGILMLHSLAAATIPIAISSHRIIPPKIFTKMALTYAKQLFNILTHTHILRVAVHRKYGRPCPRTHLIDHIFVARITHTLLFARLFYKVEP